MPVKITNPDSYQLYELRRLTLFDLSFLCAGYYPDSQTRDDALENIRRAENYLEPYKDFPMFPSLEGTSSGITKDQKLNAERQHRIIGGMQKQWIDQNKDIDKPVYLLPLHMPAEVFSWFDLFRQNRLEQASLNLRNAVEETQRANPSFPGKVFESLRHRVALREEKFLLTYTLTYAEWRECFDSLAANGKELPRNPFLNPELRRRPVSDKGAGVGLDATAPATESKSVSLPAHNDGEAFKVGVLARLAGLRNLHKMKTQNIVHELEELTGLDDKGEMRLDPLHRSKRTLEDWIRDAKKEKGPLKRGRPA